MLSYLWFLSTRNPDQRQEQEKHLFDDSEIGPVEEAPKEYSYVFSSPSAVTQKEEKQITEVEAKPKRSSMCQIL